MSEGEVFITDCFEVRIKGNSELCDKFLQFQLDNKIFGPRGGGCGMGSLVSFIYIEHKEKIEKFFKEL